MGAAPKIPDLPDEWLEPPADPVPYLRPVPDIPPEPFPPPDPPPPELPELGPFVILFALLWPSETAPAWMDELNPVTGLPYGSKKAYDDLWRQGPEEVQRQVAERRRKQAAEAKIKTSELSENDPLAPAQPCAAGEAREQSESLKKGVIQLDCDPTWDDCQKRQAREKIRRLNELAKRNNGLKRRSTTGKTRDLGNTWAAKYRSDFNRIANGKPPSKLGFTHPDASPPTGTSRDFMDPCLEKQWEDAGKGDSESSPLNECSPDHVQDLQWGGHVQGPLVWLDRDVNEKLGRDMSAGDNAEIDVAEGFEIKCP